MLIIPLPSLRQSVSNTPRAHPSTVIPTSDPVTRTMKTYWAKFACINLLTGRLLFRPVEQCKITECLFNLSGGYG
ncbi:hypothetical protein CC78DRAFT_531594 [Lojkania enalia]|uniref:Uncharacterized protein n=1 Tax=Lojkania enalia TaxID=147567 RepID=A0A9P4KC17_9PLEO|nr:hypothetical protein CC78DRAFT_531594 [Didymosphaeria enalia]